MNLIFNIFWLLRTLKYVLFWIYLWQLKEYHIPRFLDHFRTHKGKKLLLNPLQIIKILFLLGFIFRQESYALWFSAIFLIYVFETLLFAKQAFLKTFKRPKFTAKTLLLAGISFAIIAGFLFLDLNISYFLLFDILTPIIVSVIVLLVQPFFVLARNNILKKAKNRISQFKDLKVIGITGSYGKTTTKEFLTTILSEKYKVLSTKEHQNSEMGIAKCILENLNSEHKIFVVEMGSYKKGGIKLLCDIVKPEIGIVTGVNEQHLSLFGSLENLLSAEGGGELAAALPKNGLLVLNGDNKHCLNLYKKDKNLLNKKTYSVSRDKINSDIFAEDIDILKDKISFMAINKKREVGHFEAKVLGKQNVQNLLAAILVARELGINFDEISEACRNIKPDQAGIILKTENHGINIIDSSYSANPDGVIADLDFLNTFSNKKIIVMPCLIELGKKSSQIHEKLGQKIGKICDMAIVTTKENFENIKKGAVYSGMPEKNIIFSENPDDIYTMITLQCKKDDAVLLEGRVPKKLMDLLNA
jgi:UDP-N-acetylmuramoyl-tripeptide--D-alanyl-D-alanine ligase